MKTTVKFTLDDTQAKALREHIKASGTATAVLGRMGVRDRDGDLLEKGFVANPGVPVPVSQWNHSLIRDPKSKRAGVATVREEGDDFVAEVEWDDTPEGKATCKRVEEERPDWSWGFPEPKSRKPTAAEKALGVKRVITKAHVVEVSPVDAGAGIAQGTLDACCGSCSVAKSCKHRGAPKPEGETECKCQGSCGCGKAGGAKETDRDRNERVSAALAEAFGTDEETPRVDDFLSDESAVVYMMQPKTGWIDSAPRFKVSWTDGEDGIEFGDPVEVRRTTTYAEQKAIPKAPPIDADEDGLVEEPSMDGFMALQLARAKSGGGPLQVT